MTYDGIHVVYGSKTTCDGGYIVCKKKKKRFMAVLMTRMSEVDKEFRPRGLARN